MFKNIIIFLFSILLFLMTPLLVRMGNFLVVQDPLVKADAIVVLSGDLTGERVLQGIGLYKFGYADHLVMCGGPVMWHQTYAENMLRQARSFKVPEGAVLLEDRSMSTYENARFAVPLLRKINAKRIILVTNQFHTRRASWIFKKTLKPYGIEVISCPVQASTIKLNDWWKNHEVTQAVLNEYAAMVFYWLKGY
ncbi:MAG: YdcF family protein [Candidatus Margulisiibacteriota bacterium]